MHWQNITGMTSTYGLLIYGKAFNIVKLKIFSINASGFTVYQYGKKLTSFFSIINIQTLILGLIVGDNGLKKRNGGKEIMLM